MRRHKYKRKITADENEVITNVQTKLQPVLLKSPSSQVSQIDSVEESPNNSISLPVVSMTNEQRNLFEEQVEMNNENYTENSI